MNPRYPAALLCALDLGVLAGLRPHPDELMHRLSAPRAWLVQSPDAALATVSGTILWFLAAWLAVGIAGTVLSRLPGAIGRGCAAMSRLLLPGAVRRIVAGSVGLGVLLAPLPVALNSTTAAAAQVSAPVAALPSPVWPGTDATPAPPHRSPPAPRAAPPPRPPAPQHSHPTPAHDADRGAVVRPGDCLWLIAARRLGPGADPSDVAAAWPRWYAANRDRIGADPALIRPGQRLIAPEPLP